MISPPFAILSRRVRTPPFPHCVVFVQACASAIVGVILFGPPFLHLYCGDNHERHLLQYLNLLLSILGAGRGISTWPIVFVANYAYLLGFLFSLGDPLGAGDLGSNSIGSGFSQTGTGMNTATLDTKQAARAVVGLAFNSGRAQSLTWPPARPFGPQQMATVTLQDNVLGSVLLQRVYPTTVAVFVFPALVYLFYITTQQVVRRLSLNRPCYIIRCHVAVVETSDNIDASPDTPVSSDTSVGSRTLSPPGSPTIEPVRTPARGKTRTRRRQVPSKPQSPLCTLGKFLVRLLRAMSGTLAEGAVETLAPFVFGAILIVTSATVIVLYGIGHVGVASLAESGVFGLTKDAIDTLLGLVKMQWRFLRQLRWSWWLETAAQYERRYEHTVLDRRNTHTVHEHGHHVCIDTNCPFHIYGDDADRINGDVGRVQSPGNKGDDEGEGDDVFAAEQQAEPADGKPHHCRHFHHHHHHHHHHHIQTRHPNQNLPGTHVILESRRDWLRWFVGRPHRTVANDARRPATTLAAAAAEVAEGFFGPSLAETERADDHNDSDKEPPRKRPRRHGSSTEPSPWDGVPADIPDDNSVGQLFDSQGSGTGRGDPNANNWTSYADDFDDGAMQDADVSERSGSSFQAGQPVDDSQWGVEGEVEPNSREPNNDYSW